MSNEIVSIIPPASSWKEPNIVRFRKEKHFTDSWILIDLDSGDTIADCRFYWAASGTCYCCIWLWKSDENGQISLRGGGKASGGGYHKASAAMHSALSMAGVKLRDAIEGRGDSAMRDALEALAVHWQIARYKLIHAHG